MHCKLLHLSHALILMPRRRDESAPPIFVRIVDICPCNRPPQQGGRNQACCTTAPHIDLSYWAFEKLAHPLYGDITIQFRPVDCGTRQPLASSGLANATSGGVLGGATSSVYAGEPQRGWAVTSYKINWLNLTLPASGLSATSKPYPGVRNATCAQISGAGGLFGFYCTKCRDVFTDAVKLSIREAQQQSGDPTGGAVPPLRVVISKRDYNATGGGGEVYCDAKPQLGDAYKIGRSSNGYTQCVRRASRYAFPADVRDCRPFAGTPFRSTSSGARSWTARGRTASPLKTPTAARTTSSPSASIRSRSSRLARQGVERFRHTPRQGRACGLHLDRVAAPAGAGTRTLPRVS